MQAVLEAIDSDYGGVEQYLLGGRPRPRDARRCAGTAAMRVIAIFGPTASGKSAVAEALARRIPADLISADSAQLYRGLPILTNQSPAALVGIWELDHEASVAEYQALAHEAIDAALAAGRTPVVVGGTGLYFRAALAELDVPPAPEPGARERWERVYDEEGAEAAHALLAERDPEAAAAVHPNDRRRVVRALELAEAGHSLRGDRLWAADTRLPTLIVGLDVPADVLNERIEARTRGDVRRRGRGGGPAGAHATAVGDRPEDHGPARGRGAAARRGEVELAVRTRRFAAYQRKWMRRIPGLASVGADRSPDEVADEILALARGGQRVPAGRAV